ncbi:amidase [Nitratireductor soli]|uniref:amidase n=1 Tax=Nitratireductor soli TaxID=1670619 RepID=UPI0009E3BC50|nr:amidase [Nitratireductor soli]
MNPMDDVLDGSLAEAARLIRSGEVSATELVGASLARIGSVASGANPFLRVRGDEAILAARSVDAMDKEARQALPLCGVPLARKDLFSVPGETATFGAHAQFHRRGEMLAAPLARLQEAGAVDMGALHMSEFAMGPSGWSSVDGAIHNPQDPLLISGGSSSGSAAAVGARLVFGSLGTDTGGSNRIPAAFCGVVALKPSSDRIAASGVLPVSKTLDTVGPFARSVADCKLLFEALTGGTVRSRREGALRFGMLTTDSLPVEPDAEVVGALHDVAKRLESAAYPVREVRWPGFAETNLLSGTVFLAEAASAHMHNLVRHGELMGSQVRERLLQGLAFPAPLYLAAMAERAARRARFEESTLAGIDVLLLPVSPARAPARKEYAGPGIADVFKKNAHVAAYTGGFNYLDLPVLSMPASARSLHKTLGIQLVTRNGDDEVLLEAGRLIEQLAR